MLPVLLAAISAWFKRVLSNGELRMAAISCVSGSWWIRRNLSIKVGKSAVMMVRWFGLDSSMNDCLIFVIGVDSYHTVTRTVIYGYRAEARSLNKINDSVVS